MGEFFVKIDLQRVASLLDNVILVYNTSVINLLIMAAGSTSMTEPALLLEEERKKLARRILERYSLQCLCRDLFQNDLPLLISFKMPDEEIFAKIGYCSLLGAAVKHKCLWAVELLTEFGTSSNCNVDKRYVSQSVKPAKVGFGEELIEEGRRGLLITLDDLLS